MTFGFWTEYALLERGRERGIRFNPNPKFVVIASGRSARAETSDVVTRRLERIILLIAWEVLVVWGIKIWVIWLGDAAGTFELTDVSDPAAYFYVSMPGHRPLAVI